MTKYLNPFRINLDTIHTCQRLRPDRVEQLVHYMWAIFDDADDTGFDEVGDNAATPWEQALEFIDHPSFVADDYDQDITVDESIAVWERLAPQFDALKGEGWIDLRHIDAHTTILPVSR